MLLAATISPFILVLLVVFYKLSWVHFSFGMAVRNTGNNGYRYQLPPRVLKPGGLLLLQ